MKVTPAAPPATAASSSPGSSLAASCSPAQHAGPPWTGSPPCDAVPLGSAADMRRQSLHSLFRLTLGENLARAAKRQAEYSVIQIS